MNRQRAVVGFYKKGGKTRPITKSAAQLKRRKVVKNGKQFKGVTPAKQYDVARLNKIIRAVGTNRKGLVKILENSKADAKEYGFYFDSRGNLSSRIFKGTYHAGYKPAYITYGKMPKYYLMKCHSHPHIGEEAGQNVGGESPADVRVAWYYHDDFRGIIGEDGHGYPRLRIFAFRTKSPEYQEYRKHVRQKKILYSHLNAGKLFDLTMLVEDIELGGRPKSWRDSHYDLRGKIRRLPLVTVEEIEKQQEIKDKEDYARFLRQYFPTMSKEEVRKRTATHYGSLDLDYPTKAKQKKGTEVYVRHGKKFVLHRTGGPHVFPSDWVFENGKIYRVRDWKSDAEKRVA